VTRSLFLALCLVLLAVFFLGGYEEAAAVSVSSGPIELSPEEIEWLAGHPDIRIGVRNTPPLVVRDERDGSFRGIAIDYVRLLERRLGVRFKIIHYDVWRDLIEDARQRKIDVLITAVWSPDRASWLSFTRPYFILTSKIIARQGAMDKVESVEQLRGRKIGVLEGSATHEYMKRYEGLFTIVSLRDEGSGLADVSFGGLDAVIMDMGLASYYIQKDNITNLEVVGGINQNYEYGIASRSDWPRLHHIMVKGLASITRDEREAIHRRWIPSASPASILKSNVFWFSVVGSGLFVFVIMLLLWNSTLRRSILKSNTELLAITEQLHQAQKMEAVGQLAGGIAHDFNNILMAIIGYGDILRMKLREDPRLCGYIDQIIESAGRAASLTNDLLAFSRRRILNPEAVDLNKVVANMMTLLSKGLGGGVEVKTSFNKETMVYVERNQIELAIINLANNARDAMPGGGVLTIETDVIDMDSAFRKLNGFGKEGAYAVVTLADNGTGMDAETKRRIFEPFFTTKEAGRGTGLGLSMVYGVIKQHHGYISVESEPGKGTTFRIYLPLLPPDVQVERAPAVIVEDRPRRGTETILIAEDDDVLRALNRKVLEEAGYKVIEAVNGAQAVELFREHRDEIKLVILDVIMPVKGGVEAFVEIRDTKPSVRAMFISGYGKDKLSLGGIKAPEADVIFKPVSTTTLLNKIREILDRKQG
jgi:signal transduction histidine kinase/ActR/RegA family two-component response regulator